MSTGAAVTDVALVFDALANAVRREIVGHLARGAATTPEIGSRFSCSKQALNRHVVALERAGLVERVRRGRVDHLRLVPEALDGVVGWVAETRRYWSENLDRLGVVLDAMGDDV